MGTAYSLPANEYFTKGRKFDSRFEKANCESECETELVSFKNTTDLIVVIGDYDGYIEDFLLGLCGDGGDNLCIFGELEDFKAKLLSFETYEEAEQYDIDENEKIQMVICRITDMCNLNKLLFINDWEPAYQLLMVENTYMLHNELIKNIASKGKFETTEIHPSKEASEMYNKTGQSYGVYRLFDFLEMISWTDYQQLSLDIAIPEYLNDERNVFKIYKTLFDTLRNIIDFHDKEFKRIDDKLEKMNARMTQQSAQFQQLTNMMNTSRREIQETEDLLRRLICRLGLDDQVRSRTVQKPRILRNKFGKRGNV